MTFLQPDFNVAVNGSDIAILRVSSSFTPGNPDADGSCYGIGSILSDEPVFVEIRCARSLATTRILPCNAIENPQIEDDKITFQLTRHGTYIFQPETYKDTPLILFYDAEEKDAPAPDTPGVHYYGPGLHSPGKIELASNETLYLAAGAVVEASVWAEGENIRICGHGVLTQRHLPRGAVRHCLDFYQCNHVELRDFICTDPCMWNVVFRDSHDILVDNIKICGSRMINDDAVDICNSTDVVIRNSFIRSRDDIIAIKGMLERRELTSLKMTDQEMIHNTFDTDRRGIRNVLVENCIFWCDTANIFRYGYECIAETMENITVRNCDIVHVSDCFKSPEAFWCNTVWYLQPSHRMPMRDLLFEDLRIYVDVPDLVLMKITPMECGAWTECGTLRNCTFRNITVTAPESYRGQILIAGADAEHNVENIHLENVTINGKRIDRNFAYLTIGDYAENITLN